MNNMSHQSYVLSMTTVVVNVMPTRLHSSDLLMISREPIVNGPAMARPSAFSNPNMRISSSRLSICNKTGWH